MYAISTPIDDQYAGDGIAIRGIAYGMPTIRVDEMIYSQFITHANKLVKLLSETNAQR